MPQEFKIYQIAKQDPSMKEKTLGAVKRAFRDLIGGPLISWTPPVPLPSDQHLFFKTREGISWGRILYEPLNYAMSDRLQLETVQVMKVLKEDIGVYFFLPASPAGARENFIRSFSGTSEKLLPARGRTRFYEYSLLWSKDHDAIALKEWTEVLPLHEGGDEKETSRKLPAPVLSPEKVYQFHRHSHLTRSEVTDLLELVLAAKRI